MNESRDGGRAEGERPNGDPPPPRGAIAPAHGARLRRAVENYRSGAYAQAEAHARALLEEHGASPSVLEILGLSLVAQQRSSEAEPYLLDALRIGGESSNLLFALGVVAADRGAWDEAKVRYARLIERDPRFPEARFNYARALEECGETESSLNSYKDILENDERHADAALHYALLLEECNRVEESAVWLSRFLSLRPSDVRGRLLAAQLELRLGRPREALAILENLETRPLSPRTAAVVSGRRVRALDVLGRYADAARAADEGHAKIRALASEPEDPRDPYGPTALMRLASCRDRLRSCDSGWTWPSHLPAPDFLVGFPRSGTTLLDRMLAAHPEVRVLEETNPLAPLIRRLAESLPSGGGDLVFDSEARTLAARVAEEIGSGRPPGVRVLLDKLPLNSAYAGWLARLIPESRFVVVVRDPRDVVLSCWLQTFAPNAAMRQFWDLGTTVDYYERVMELLRFWLEATLPAERRRIVRYEDLVRGPRPRLEALSSFLGIEFRVDMLDPARAAKGVRLGTPSYDQVTRPIHEAAVGRWRHYATVLTPHLARLEPWVQYWGYGERERGEEER